MGKKIRKGDLKTDIHKVGSGELAEWRYLADGFHDLAHAFLLC